MSLVGNLPVDPKDPWALATTGYAKDKIYTRSTDGHGHSDPLYVKLSPALMAVVCEAVEKVDGYRTKADVIRDALIHRMHEVNEWMKLPSHVNLQPVDVEVRMAELQELQAKRHYWDALIKELDDTLNELVKEGDFETAAWVLQENAAIESMSPPYLLKLGAVIDRYRERIGQGLRETTLND